MRLDRGLGQESEFGSNLLERESCVPCGMVRQNKMKAQGWAVTGFVPNVQTES